ncbi:MAG: LysM peptidoglycan-binding domain-containing protein [Phycisphaerales bacterium]
MTRELKLALIVGFSVLLVVTVLISDHLSKAQTSKLAVGVSETPAGAPSMRPREQLVAEPPAKTDTRLAVAEPSPTGELPAPGAAPSPVVDRPLVIEQGGRSEPRVLADAIKPGTEEDIIIPNRTGGGVPLADTRSVGSGLEDVSRRTAGSVLPEPEKAKIVPEALTQRDAKPQVAKPEVTPSTAPERFHTVAAGENLSKLSRKYYGDPNQWKRIADANPKAVGKNGEVRVGARITIPQTTPGTKPAAPQTRLEAPERTVAKSEAGVKTTPKVETPRNDVPRAGLKPPQTELAKADRPVVKEPVGRPESAKVKAGSYTVRSGDTLSQIAQRELGSVTRMKDILELNKDVFDKDRPAVRVGQVIKLPKA